MNSNGTKRPEMRIMFVDNDLDYLEMVEAAFNTSHTIACIENGGISALGKLSKMKYQLDAMITDLAMTDMDGITLTEQVRKNERIRRSKPIDIYWFTGFWYDQEDPNDPIVKAASDLGVKKIFTKPYSVMDIIDEVKQMTVERDFTKEPEC